MTRTTPLPLSATALRRSALSVLTVFTLSLASWQGAAAQSRPLDLDWDGIANGVDRDVDNDGLLN